MQLSIPTPSISAFEVGPLTIHFYALCIIAAVAVAIWLGNKRFIRLEPTAVGVVADVAIIAVPAGVIGGRLYHVVTTPEEYFGNTGSLLNIFKIWNGGLGIWGAIALGTLGAWFSYSRRAMSTSLPAFAYFADALAPGILSAQAIGRWGNWFNGELFGRPLDAPWALSIPVNLRPTGFESFATFHPTFLYESIGCALLAILLIRLGDRFPAGAIFALYVSSYSVMRFFIESIRIDPSHMLAGLRLNQYVSAAVAGLGFFAFRRISRVKR